MPSYDVKFCIERYPQENGGSSWGCPDLNLMGYILLEDLFKDIHLELSKRMMKS